MRGTVERTAARVVTKVRVVILGDERPLEAVEYFDDMCVTAT